MLFFWLVPFICVVKSQDLIAYWRPVPVLEGDFVNALNDTVYEGESKSEIACSLEATRARANLFCFSGISCRFSNLTVVQSWDDASRVNSSLSCRTRLEGCIYQGQLFQLGDLYEVEEECRVCTKWNIMVDFLQDTPMPSTSINLTIIKI